MIFSKTKLSGVFVIDIEKIKDERGFFARVWDRDILYNENLNSNLVQCSISYNNKKGTLRGMHYQKDPHQETKIVRCTRGRIYDVAIDLRPGSKTFREWIGVELSSDNYKMLYIPEGFAHGFQTLEDNSEVFYQITNQYNKNSASGIRWNDPMFNIKWPLEITVISERDKNFSDFAS